MNYYQKAILILLLISNLFAQFPKDIDKEMRIGLEYLTNYQFDSAEVIYTEITKKHLSEPLGWFYLMETKLEKFKYENEFEQANILLENEIDMISELFKNKLEEQPRNVIYLVYYGSFNGLSAEVNLSKGNYITAFKSGRKSIKLVEKAHEIDSQYYDLFLPLGSYDFYGGVLADNYSVVDLIYDSETKRKQGIEKLTIAFEKGVGAKWEAGRILLLIHLHETRDYEKAFEIGEKLVEKFPHNLEYKSLFIELLIYMNKIERAENMLEKYLISHKNISASGKKMWEVREKYLSAVMNMQKGNYENSIKLFKFVIENYNLEFQWFKVLAYLKIGQIYDLKNNRELAKKYYKLAIDTKETTRGVSEAKKYLELPFRKSKK
ncbi:MAG: hypothetical protein U9N76_03675 [Candidatus Marinimicrobia bacterium]|nr:hypothetical protein [Candidatus Neomarinimicrobiota bacterium]